MDLDLLFIHHSLILRNLSVGFSFPDTYNRPSHISQGVQQRRQHIPAALKDAEIRLESTIHARVLFNRSELYLLHRSAYISSETLKHSTSAVIVVVLMTETSINLLGMKN